MSSKFCDGCGANLVAENPWQTASQARVPPAEPSSIAPSAPEEDSKACQFCGESIKKVAIKCRYCQSDLRVQSHDTSPVKESAVQQIRECPYCAEDISRDDSQCTHCGSMLTGPKGISAPASSARVVQPVKTAKALEKRSQPINSSTRFCTNCGDHVANNAIACTNCGAAPRTQKKYCYTCGTPLNAAQVICLSCGSTVHGDSKPRGHKKKLSAGLCALLLPVGIHKFYLGSWGWGIIYLLCAWTFIPCLVALIEGICLLTMSEDRFNAKYNIEEPGPFKW